MQELSEDSMESPLLLEASRGSVDSSLLLEQEASSAKAPPYFRFRLSSQSIPPILPAAMEQRMSIEIWDGFWSKLEPIVRREELLAKNYKSKSFAFFVGWLTCTYVICRKIPERYMVTCLLLAYVVLLVPLFVVSSFIRRARRAHVEAIRTLCRDEEENVFRSCRFSLECEDEWATRITWKGIREGIEGGYCIYFLPLECNCRRIKVFDGSPAWCGWNSSLISSVAASYENLPTGFESLPEDIWDEFWSKVIDISEKSLVLKRLHVVSIFMPNFMIALANLVFFRYTGTLPHTLFMVTSLCALALALVGFFALGRFSYLHFCRRILVQEYASSFADHGIYMEYRGLYKSHWSGPYGCFYVYLYPLSTNIDAVESGCCGSINHESSVTKRMGGPSIV